MLENQFAQVTQNLSVAMEELESIQLTGAAGGGAVKVTVTGAGQVLKVEIAPAAVEPSDIELLQDLVCAAMRDAMAKATATRREKLMQASPLAALGANLPDMF
jgi:DNA-binding YbaB/EbfC family protein